MLKPTAKIIQIVSVHHDGAPDTFICLDSEGSIWSLNLEEHESRRWQLEWSNV